MSESSALQEFIARHAVAYDPVNDVYERPPFAADIKEGKNDPIYNVHSYHTKVPPRGIVPYILHYTEPGDLVLDPFCGSGMTGVAAQVCTHPPVDILEQFPELKDRIGPRACILNDLSPAACHIAYNYNTSVETEGLRRAFRRVEAAVEREIEWLYGTEHYEPAIGPYAPEALTRHEDLLGIDSGHKWTLIPGEEVKRRLGYPLSELPRDPNWGDADLAKVEQWVCIPATIQYTIWSDVYRCQGFVTIAEPTGKLSTRGKNIDKPILRKKRVARGCGQEIILWDAAVDPEGEVNESFVCPSCGHPWKKINLKRCGVVPVVSNYSYSGLRFRKNGLEASNCRTERKVSAIEKSRVREIWMGEEPYWTPAHPMDPQGPQYRRNALRVRQVADARDFYTKRNLRALAALWVAAADTECCRVREHIRFCITSICMPMSRMYAYRPDRKGGILKGSLYIPSLTQEMNVGTAFSSKIPAMLAVAERRARSDADAIVTCGSATSIPIPDSSIDYIFTDPPFGSNTYYSEASYIWESWLDDFTDRALEAVVHRKADGGTKRIEDYARLMQAAFNEMFRVLKPGRWATVEFNNSDGAVFEAIKQATRGAGFEIVNMLLLDKEQKTFKQVKGAEGIEDVVDKDVLFNIYKPAVVGTAKVTGDDDLEQRIVDVVRQHLATLPARIKAEPAKYSEEHRTTATINSILMNALIPRGVDVERLNLAFIERVCVRFFRKVGQRWYLRGEAAGGMLRDGLIEEEIQIKDELSAIDWLRQKLATGPKLPGELKPLWMRAIGLLSAEVSQTLVLENLLSENFWRDTDTNRWREPTPEEREKMNDDRSLRALHDAERFVNGTLRRSTTDTERANWIDVLFQACRAVEDGKEEALPALRGFDPDEAYGLVTRLYQGILREHLTTDAWRKVEKQANAASRKLALRANEQKSNVIKARGEEGGQAHFDFGKA